MAPEEFDRLAVDKVDFALNEGDIAPPLSLPTADGRLVHSRELLRVGPVDLVFDVIGGDIAKRSAGVIRAGGTLVPSPDRPRRGPPTAWRSTLFSCPIAPNWGTSSAGAAD